MTPLLPKDFPLTLGDDEALFEVRDSPGRQVVIYRIGKREFLSLEALTRKHLKRHFSGSGYSFRALSVCAPMAGPNQCAIRLVIHLDGRTYPTLEDLINALVDSIVVWDAGDFYYDINE